MCSCQEPHELVASIDAFMEQGRWVYTGVGVGPPTQLKWLYTVGLAEQFGHPELLVVGICCGSCGGNMLNTVAERVAGGERFDAPTVEPLVFPAGGMLHVRPVHRSCWESDWFAIWHAYYDTKPYDPPPMEAVQLVYTDRRDRFPWEPGCDPIIADHQQLTDAPRRLVPSRDKRARRASRPRRWNR